MNRTVNGFFSFAVGGDPRPQGSMTVFNGRMVHVKSAKLRDWRDQVTEAAREAMPPDWPTEGTYRADLDFVLRRPKSHFRKSPITGLFVVRADAPALSNRRPDVDKLARAVLDALTMAGCWSDDSRVASLAARKNYGLTPRLTCTLYNL